MLTKEIIEGNKLIAEFAGLTIITDGISFFDTKYKQLKMYNESWDYLMPIVDKIEHLYETEKSLPVFDINSHHARFAVSYPFKYKNWIVGIGAKSAEKIKADSKIEATWMVVVEFIKWYNETNKKS